MTMPKSIKFISLHLINYTSHDDITLNYGDITKLSGKNGEGKSSIGGAPVWIFWGCDLYGSKFDPSPTDRPFDRVYASLTLTIDGVEQTIAREIVGGTNKFYVNEVPMKAKEFESHIATLFEKEQFLSLYSPGFFFTQHWSKQREQVMRHVSPPTNKEVFQAMSRTSPEQKAKDITLNPYAERLEVELKKHSVGDLEKKYTDIKNKNDKLHIQSQGSVKTLTEQLRALGEQVVIDREALQAEGEELDSKIRSYEADKLKVYQCDVERSRLQNQIDNLDQRLRDDKQQFEQIKAQPIDMTCNHCGQELTDEAKETAKGNKKASATVIMNRYNENLKKRTELKEQLANTPPLEAPDYSVADLMSRIAEINSLLQTDFVRRNSTEVLERAKQAESEHLNTKNDAIFVLDAVKSFKAKEAELQVGKVQELFTTLSVRLFDYVASTGEYKPTFVIQMAGKDYEKLSAGEKIGAGLELSDVLYKQSELVVPVFVDGIESYTGKVAVYGQLITGRAVPEQELKIESEVIA